MTRVIRFFIIYIMYTMDTSSSNAHDSNDPIDLYIAFDYIKNEILKHDNKTKACRDAAEKFGISGFVESIVKHYRRFLSAGERMHKMQWFSTKDEVTFCLILESFSLLGRPLTRHAFLNMVRRYPGYKYHENYDDWFRKFKGRFRNYITSYTAKGLDMDRAIGIDYSEVDTFINSSFSTIRNLRIPHCRMFNIDETRMTINGENHNQKVIVSRSTCLHDYILPKSDEYAGSYVPIIANDSIFLQFLVVPGLKKNEKMIIEKWETKEQGDNADNANKKPPLDLFMIKTETGYVNCEAFHLIIEHFANQLRLQNISDHVLLSMDHLNIHMSEENMRCCTENRILTSLVPTHAMHIYQPEDNLFFLQLKNTMYLVTFR